MKPKYIHVEPRFLDVARRIIDATEQRPKAQTWICSNCGLERRFVRKNRLHKCSLIGRFTGWHGIWYRKGLPALRTLVIPSDNLFPDSEYLIQLRHSALVISVDGPQPFDMTTPNRSGSKQYANSLPSL